MTNETLAELRKHAAKMGLKIETYNPGDGRRYRVFMEDATDYFCGGHLHTSMRLAECRAFIFGYKVATEQAIEADEAAHGPIPSFLRRTDA